MATPSKTPLLRVGEALAELSEGYGPWLDDSSLDALLARFELLRAPSEEGSSIERRTSSPSQSDLPPAPSAEGSLGRPSKRSPFRRDLLLSLYGRIPLRQDVIEWHFNRRPQIPASRPLSFLSLHKEIRTEIYKQFPRRTTAHFFENDNGISIPLGYVIQSVEPTLLQTCRQVYEEAKPYFVSACEQFILRAPPRLLLCDRVLLPESIILGNCLSDGDPFGFHFWRYRNTVVQLYDLLGIGTSARDNASAKDKTDHSFCLPRTAHTWADHVIRSQHWQHQHGQKDDQNADRPLTLDCVMFLKGYGLNIIAASMLDKTCRAIKALKLFLPQHLESKVSFRVVGLLNRGLTGTVFNVFRPAVGPTDDSDTAPPAGIEVVGGLTRGEWLEDWAGDTWVEVDDDSRSRVVRVSTEPKPDDKIYLPNNRNMTLTEDEIASRMGVVLASGKWTGDRTDYRPDWAFKVYPMHMTWYGCSMAILYMPASNCR